MSDQTGTATVDKATEKTVVFGVLNPLVLDRLIRTAIVALAKAIDAYEAETKKPATFQDDQDFFSVDYQLGMGGAEFNATALHGKTYDAALAEVNEPTYRSADGKASLAGILFAALKAQEGNIPQAMGSVAKLFHDKRTLAAKVEALPYDPKSEKDYYLFAGIFVGTQPNAAIRDLGRLGAKLNIALNPLSRLMNVIFGDMKWSQLPGFLGPNNLHKFQLLEAGYMVGEIVRKRKQKASDKTMLQWILDVSYDASKYAVPGMQADLILREAIDITTP